MSPRQYKREPLDGAQTERLLQACQTFREKLIVFTLLDTGMRVSELTNLTNEDIQWQEKRLKIRGKGGPFGKQTKIRVLPMTDRVRPLIEHHFAMEDTFGMTARQVQRIVRAVANRAGISKPVSPHVLRHSFSVTCLKRGIGLRTLQSLLGHDHIQTTEIYMNLSPEDAIREFQDRW